MHGKAEAVPRSKLICIDVRDCTAIGPKAVDMLNMLLPCKVQAPNLWQANNYCCSLRISHMSMTSGMAKMRLMRTWKMADEVILGTTGK